VHRVLHLEGIHLLRKEALKKRKAAKIQLCDKTTAGRVFAGSHKYGYQNLLKLEFSQKRHPFAEL